MIEESAPLLTLLQAPMNHDVPEYKGLYRVGLPIEFMENADLSMQLQWFFENSHEGFSIEFTGENVERMLRLFQDLKARAWNGDLVAFTPGDVNLMTRGYVLAGYDICGASMYYSPLGDGFLNRYDAESSFFSGMSESEYHGYIQDLNRNRLFSTHRIAQRFADYCRYINGLYPHVIESENEWQPFRIHLYTPGTRIVEDENVQQKHVGGHGDLQP